MSDNLPADLLSNILVRLPFHSLIQYRCVSKSWRDSIDSPYFTEMYSQQSLLLKTYPHPDSKIIAFNEGKFYAFDSVQKISRSLYNVRTAKELKFPLLNSEFSKRTISFVGSSNGILCLSNSRTDSLMLWNPWTGKCSMLPSCPEEFTKHYRWSKGYNPVVGAAFGHDPISLDYKVVKWHTCLNHSTMSSSDRYEVCVYSLKTNSWKRVPFDLPEEHLGFDFFPSDATFVNGSIHWFPWNKLIIAFDLKTEGFRKISCEPCQTSSHFSLSQELCCLNGRLCYVSHLHDVSAGRDFLDYGPYGYGWPGWDIWEMEDDGVEGSWRKIMSTADGPDHPSYCSRLRPLALSGKTRRLFFQWKVMMGVYDVEKKVFGEVLIDGEPIKSAVSCFLCVGSFANPCHSSV